MKVLEVFGEPISHGGQESFVFNVLQHMDLSDLEIDVLTPYHCDNEHYRKILEDLNGHLYALDIPFTPGKSRGNIFVPLKSFLQEKDYDVVHIHSGSISILALAALAAKICKIKTIVVHSHCAGERKTIKYRLTKAAMTPLLDRCPTDYCACSVEAGKWKYSTKIIKKLVVLKNGVDLDKFCFSEKTRKQMRMDLGLDNEDFVIGHVGRFSYQKNQEYIIDLLKLIKPIIPRSKVLFIGSGETMEQIKLIVKENGQEDDVLFVGNVNNVQDYLQTMDLFVLPSRYEGLPIVGVEAQAAGLHVITSTNVSKEMDITSQVEFIPLENIEKWVNAIEENRNGIRMNTRARIIQAGYDINTTAIELKKIYLKNITQ